MAPDPLHSFTDALMHMVWTRIIPCIFLAAIAGIAFRSMAEGFGTWLGRKVRDQRQTRRSAAYSGMNDDEILDALHCPKCNSLMVKRKAGRGPSAGEEFWGCKSFPKCRGTRKA